MEAKFKVGDKVRILDGRGIPNYRGCFAHDMIFHVGKEVTIREVLPPINGIGFGYCVEGNSYAWDERGLELVEDKRKPIVIYCKDNQVIALDQSTKKKGIATCSPTDMFDFNTGAKIAFARLMGEEVKTGPAVQKTKADPEIQDFLQLLKDMIDITEKSDHFGILK